MSKKLSFNQMIDKCWKTALSISTECKFYQGSSDRDMKFVNCTFRGDAEDATIQINCTNKGVITIHSLKTPYMGDCVINLPVDMELKEAEGYLKEAGYTKKWTVVVLREPLYSVKYNPLYIFTVPTTGSDFEWVAVDSTDGKVFTLEGLKIEYKN